MAAHTPFYVPPPLVEAFRAFLKMEARLLEQARDALAKAGVVSAGKDFQNTLVATGLPAEFAENLQDLLIGFGTLQRQIGEEVEDVINGIDAGVQIGNRGPKLSDVEKASWTSRKVHLSQMLSLPGVRLLAKSAELAFEYRQIARSAKIITEIRPVFADGDERFPIAVTTQVLHLRYFEDGQDKTVAVQLDESDVVELRTACDRAMKKLETVRRTLNQAEIKPYTVGSDDIE